MQTVPLSIISLSSGFIGSLMSGGSIVIFSLLTFLGIPVQSAVGTLKVAIAALTIVSAITYYRGGAVEVRTAPYLTTFSVLGALWGSYFFSSLPEGSAGALSLVLLLMGLYFSIRPGSEMSGARVKKASSAWISGVGLLIGAYIGIRGIASTLIVIAALRAFFGMDMLKANGTAKALIFFNNLVAAGVYGLGGQIEYSLLLPVVVPVCVGAWLGVKAGLKLGSEGLRWFYILIGAATALKLLSELVWGTR
ncbi:sulfite exporter TauE/SafE family protein [Thermococcus sp. Bubb.Bath]|uniref:TSUP family transporter n=1 Tax=Thermococcus sp. Bubb.Bath TaxID=1638242 RepID=UPI00143C2871|nr:sulfite exporter TauE/SafE family protein [Thermococcus sp. Bubb.Bath]